MPALVLHSLVAEDYPFGCTTVCLRLSQRMDIGLLLVVGNAKLQEARVSAVPLASHLMQLLGLTMTLTFGGDYMIFPGVSFHSPWIKGATTAQRTDFIIQVLKSCLMNQ